MSDDGNFTSSEWDDLINDANKDDRVGDHNALVAEITQGLWEDGREKTNITLNLLTARGAKVFLNFSEQKMAPRDIKAKHEAGEMEDGMYKAIVKEAELQQQLAKFYGAGRKTLKQGDILRVKTVKNKKGYIRVIAIKPKEEIGKAPSAVSEIPF